ncbi:MAG TPA: TetR/AcrR family transcriptional regulator [Candidatus Eisenbergiella intestinipullorum]|nr:TetR/AcrR family transcriptional regulator [Candidatus Eisenbergiella intestinipullorum]
MEKDFQEKSLPVQSKTDRRIRKTKARLLQSLMTLMQEKDIKDISVKELSDLADINRGTFYLHYRDVYDMLSQVEDSIFQEFNEILDKNFAPGTGTALYSILKDIFTFLNENRLMGRTLLGPHGDLAFVNRMKEIVRLRLLRLQDEAVPASPDFDYYYAFITSGCIGLIQSWLNRENPEPPDRIAALVEKMILQGLTPMFPAPMRV